MKLLATLTALLVVCALPARGDGRPTMPETDVFKTTAGELKITFVGHGTLLFTLGKTVIHVDPVSREADYAKMPKADLILVTHEHGDHLDPAAIAAVRKEGTVILLPQKCASAVPGSTVIKNGETRTVGSLKIEAVPAYNVVHTRPDGEPYHPRGVGNGYVITFGRTRVYVAGDTEDIPEMKQLRDIDIAFLPMNLPYTMTPAMVAAAGRAFHPKILYPYHYGDTEPAELVRLLKDDKTVEVRIRKLK
jgi:L-ascorbate metabolism protein UlaG (beta-lactamase superfamily)